MKKLRFLSIIITSILFACGNGDQTEQAIIGDAETFSSEAGLEAASEKFSNGEAKNAEDFFTGMLSDIIDADIKLREVTELDEIDASAEKIESVLNEAKKGIAKGRNSLTLYQDKNWPLREEFTALSNEWYDKIEACIDHLFDLASPMSRPDDTWSEEELEAYEEYVILEDQYKKIDLDWIDYQYVFAEANNIILEGNIDEEALLEEQLEEQF